MGPRHAENHARSNAHHPWLLHELANQLRQPCTPAFMHTCTLVPVHHASTHRSWRRPPSLNPLVPPASSWGQGRKRRRPPATAESQYSSTAPTCVAVQCYYVVLVSHLGVVMVRRAQGSGCGSTVCSLQYSQETHAWRVLSAGQEGIGGAPCTHGWPYCFY